MHFVNYRMGDTVSQLDTYTLMRSYSKKRRVPVTILSCNAADILLCVPEYEIAVCIISAGKDEKENIAYQ